jgi:hypothetical protein
LYVFVYRDKDVARLWRGVALRHDVADTDESGRLQVPLLRKTEKKDKRQRGQAVSILDRIHVYWCDDHVVHMLPAVKGEHKTRDARQGMQGKGCKARDARQGMQGKGCKARDARQGMQGKGCKARDDHKWMSSETDSPDTPTA